MKRCDPRRRHETCYFDLKTGLCTEMDTSGLNEPLAECSSVHHELLRIDLISLCCSHLSRAATQGVTRESWFDDESGRQCRQCRQMGLVKS